MSRVGDQRDGVRPKPSNRLDDDECHVEAGPEREGKPEIRRSMTVTMPVPTVAVRRIVVMMVVV